MEPFTLHPAPCTLHPTPCTPRTLHPAPRTPHPAPLTLHPLTLSPSHPPPSTLHLSNNSIAKHSDEFKSKDVSDGNMWDLPTFRRHLADTRGAEGDAAWDARIKPAMINAVNPKP